MEGSERLPPKKEVVLKLLEETDVMVHLDPRHVDVCVPKWFKKQPQLVLQIGLNLPVPIPDLEVDDEALTCTLSFNRTPFFCFLPWDSIYALVGGDGRGMVWPDDVPAEVAAQLAGAMGNVEKPRPHLRAVPASGAAEESGDSPGPGDSDKPTLSLAEATSPEDGAAAKTVESSELADAGNSTEEAPEEEPSDEQGDSKKRKLPPYLRVVK